MCCVPYHHPKWVVFSVVSAACRHNETTTTTHLPSAEVCFPDEAQYKQATG